MKNRFIHSLILAVVASVTFVACDDEVQPIEEMQFSRGLTPLGLEPFIRNKTTIELQWDVREGVTSYIVEFSEDSLLFETIVFTDEVSPEEIPYRHTFAGETRYSARVKAVGAEGQEDSKWAVTTIKTDAENIYRTLPGDNVQDTYATLLWEPGSEVTHFLIVPGNTERPITAEEKAAGEAMLTGLSGSTAHTVTLYNGNKRRGTIQFTTLRAADVFPTDDLSVVLAAAADGAELMFAPGVYTYTGTITLTKSITLVGQKPHDKPKLNVAFNIAAGAGTVTLKSLELIGTTGALGTVINLSTAAAEHTAINLIDCNIHDYARQLIYGNVAAKLGTFLVENCVISDFVAGGGDFIDFRLAYVANVILRNSTFDNTAPARDFVRIDAAAGFAGTGLTSNVLIEHCTIYGVSNTQDRILYVRFNANSSTVKNTLIAGTDGYYTNQPTTTQPSCVNNNYFGSAGFFTAAYVTNAKHDNSGTHTTLDPGFANAAGGNFTLSNQTLIDNQIGDPRWRQ